MTPRTLARRSLLLVAVVALAGCAAPAPLVIVGEAPRVRLFGVTPAMLTPWSDLLVVEPAATLPVTIADWRISPASGVVDEAGGGVQLNGTVGHVVLEHALEGALATARRIEATVVGVEAGEVRLRWGPAGEAADAGWARMSRLPATADRYRVDVDADPSWLGAEVVRLEIWTRRGSRPTVVELAAFSKRLEDEVLPSLRAAPLKLELAGDARNACVIESGGEFRRRLEVRASGRLRFAFGVPAAARRPVDVTVMLTPAAGASVVVAHERIEPGGPQAGRWIAGETDLAGFVGTTVELVVGVAVEGAADPAADLLLLVEPEVVASPAAAATSGPSLVLISVDALRADGLSLYGNPAPTSPAIDAWARRAGWVARQVVAAAPWTLPAHMSMLTGLDAVRHGVNHDVGDARRLTAASPTASLVTLAEVLHDAGFATAAVTGGAYVDARYGFAQGFDSYASWPDRANDADELRAGVDRTLAWIRARRGERFFAFLHTYAVHDPYRSWGRFLAQVAPDLGPVAGSVALVADPTRADDGFVQHNRFVRRDGSGQHVLGAGPTELALVRGMYHAGVAHADAELGRLLTGLDELGVSDRTLVVITSDHGECLGEHGRVGHVDLTDDALLVPLIMAVPGGRGAGNQLAQQVRQVDLMPTVLELLGVAPPPDLDGVSLVPAIDGGQSPAPGLAFSYATAPNRGLGLRDAGRLKYLLNTTAWREVAGEEALYDLASDPAEVVDLAATDARTSALRERAREYLAATAVGLRLAVRNPGPGAVTATLEGAMVRPVGTASLGRLSEPWVRWVEPDEAALEAPTGADYTLLFEKVMDRTLRLTGDISAEAGPIPFEWQVDVRDLGAGRWLVLDGAGWREVATRPAPAATSFGLTWLGPAAVRGASPAEDDAALREQLRALGYVDTE